MSAARLTMPNHTTVRHGDQTGVRTCVIGSPCSVLRCVGGRRDHVPGFIVGSSADRYRRPRDTSVERPSPREHAVRVLVAEDEGRLAALLDQSLTEAGWQVAVAAAR